MAPVYLLLLAALVDLGLILRLRRSGLSFFEVLSWSVVSLLLLISAWAARETALVNWLNWMPSEIQFAIGTEYVSLKETYILSWPITASFAASLSFVLITVARASFVYFASTLPSLPAGRLES
jgi:hypothetical protein